MADYYVIKIEKCDRPCFDGKIELYQSNCPENAALIDCPKCKGKGEIETRVPLLEVLKKIQFSEDFTGYVKRCVPDNAEIED